MFSLAGVPPFIGFWAKLGVIQAVLGVTITWLAVVAVLFSVVGAFFYLRIVKLMYFDDPIDKTADRRLHPHARGAQRQCAAGVRSRRDTGQLDRSVPARAAVRPSPGPGSNRLRRSSWRRTLALAWLPGRMGGSPVRGGAVWQLVGLITRRS